MRQTLLMALCFLTISTCAWTQEAKPLDKGAEFYKRGMNALLGSGPSQNNQTAIQLLQTSAQLGYSPAYTVLGYFYDTGTIVPSDPGQAAEWYLKAANEGDPLGQWLLGRLYFTGAGMQRDLNNAERFLQQAAQQEDPFAEYLLGSVKLERQNYKAAADLFRKAAEQGLPQAQKQLGQMLEQGQGIPENKQEAYVWLFVSFDAGNQSVANDLSALEGDLGSKNLEQAKDKARDLESNVRRTSVAHGCTGWPGEFNVVPSPPPPDLQRFCR